VVKKIDARGLQCPKPVILTKNALEEGETVLEVLVDNKVACDNVSRLGQKMNCSVEAVEADGNFTVKLAKSEKSDDKVEKCAAHSTVVFINSNVIGKGSDELGGALMRAFLSTLTESNDKPSKVIFMNGGVEMVVEDSPALDSVKNLENQGIEILACGTCLDYFNLKDKVAVGRISNMYDILDSFMAADKVLTI